MDAETTFAVLRCFECRGSGFGWAGTGEEMAQIRITCPACLGTGKVEVGGDDEDGDEGWESAPYDFGLAA